MANKSGNFVIRLVLIILVAGAIFFALDHFLSGSKKAQVAGGSTLTHDQAVEIGREIGTRVGNEVGERIGRQVAAEMLAQRASEKATQTATAPAQPAASSPETVAVTAPEKPEPAPAPQSAETPKPATPAPAPTHAAETPAVAPEAATPVASSEAAPETASAETAPAKPASPKAAATWWDKSLSDAPDALIMKYAGQLKSADPSSGGVALLFSGRFDSSSDFAGHIKVTGSNGQAVPGTWQNGANPGLVFLKGVPRGRYTVDVSSGLKDADGKVLKHDLSGPVKVD